MNKRLPLYVAWVLSMLGGTWLGATAFGFLVLIVSGGIFDPHWANSAPMVVPTAAFGITVCLVAVPTLVAGFPASRALQQGQTSHVAALIVCLPFELLFGIGTALMFSVPTAPMEWRHHPSLRLTWYSAPFALIFFPIAIAGLNILMGRLFTDAAIRREDEETMLDVDDA